MTEPLSPAAQAVRNAFFDCENDFMCSVAAALRALADQVAPDEPDSEILAIAAELEGHQ